MKFLSRADIRTKSSLLSDFLEYIILQIIYYKKRLHSKIGYLPSIEFEEAFSLYGVDVNEREVTMEEIGKKPKDIRRIVVIEVNRGNTIYPATELDNIILEKGDWLVFIEEVI